jgi:hypothetical protein
VSAVSPATIPQMPAVCDMSQIFVSIYGSHAINATVGNLGIMGKFGTPAIAAALGILALSAAGAGQAHAGGINILNPLFGSWLLGGGPERQVATEVAAIAPNAGVTVNGVRCNYGYVVRGGERIRQEICESTR